MSKRKPNPELCAAIGSALKQALRERGLSLRSAAKILQVSPQLLSVYTRGKAMPGSEILREAMMTWEFDVEFRGNRFGVDDLTHRKRATETIGRQTTIWDAVKSLDDEALTIEVLKKAPESVQLRLTVNFKKG